LDFVLAFGVWSLEFVLAFGVWSLEFTFGGLFFGICNLINSLIFAHAFSALDTRTRIITGYLPAGRQGVSDYGSINNKMYYVYVLKSKVNGQQYKGLTENIKRRVSEHNSGKNKSTKPYRPWELVFSEQFETRVEARKYEKWLKSGVGREFLKRILDP
jgi:putative endonuclease